MPDTTAHADTTTIPCRHNSSCRNSSDLGTYKKINWLDHWGPIIFHCDPIDQVKISELQFKIRVLVRGWLAEHNAINNTNFMVFEFEFQKRSTGTELPLRYDAYAFLIPPATIIEHKNGNRDERPVGGHLIPPPPNPPSR